MGTPICETCLDRLYPEMKLGKLRSHLLAERKRNGTCPYCGWTDEGVKKSGLYGCPLCYEALEPLSL